jgi:hypothetical protein
MNTPQQNDLDGALDRALKDDRDSILPSLGFAESVMAAVRSEDPAPLRFPWKRALPGLTAGIVAVAGVTAGDIWVLERMPARAATASASDWHAMLAPMLQRAASPAMGWTLVALLIPLVSLWLTRRLLFSR